MRNWNVDLEHAADCGQMTGKLEVIHSDEKKSGFAERADRLAWMGRQISNPQPNSQFEPS
jgi:hypothetical protein